MLEANKENVTAMTTRMLDSECKISLQESERLLENEKPFSSQMCIEFSDLCYSVRDRKGIERTILRDVSGHFEPRKLTVIVGPSGAGKTTLLEIISDKRLFNIKGLITVNGIERNRGTFRKQVCYVPQQFDLLPFLTTRETLYIAARLKFDANQSKQAIYLIVNEIVENLNLSSCLETLASKLSGGERKRLSIGVEMIAKPHILLLDEPTSGLDSAASNQLINMLHDMAKANCTVICTIHQPSSQMVSLIDNIMVLDRGRCMYCGPKNEIINTYNIAGYMCPSFYNIVEFVLEVITGHRGGDLENLHKICCSEYEKFKLGCKHHESGPNSLTISKQKSEIDDKINVNSIIQKKSTWQQQKILFLRALICIKRDNTLTKLRLAAHVIIGLLLGVVFYNFGYDAGKVYSNISCLFFILLFLFFANSMPAVQMCKNFFQIGMFLIPATSIPLLLFAGFFLKIEEMSKYLQPFGVISFYRYAFEGLMQAIYLDREILPCLEYYCSIRSPNKILDTMGMPTVSFYVILIILGSWILCIHIIIYAVLCWKIYYAKK
ncbi:ATP-binding cassette sub-family G member 1-like [Pogonomyrmex barbatus]|uniref:ATP-binding cassette sub-family G member 1-like n=1 Tax=Pogonomyrmex barbatus TaxID=144034 RepID=A0A8N1SBV9_9HYME|nr:ATP-binding cassette sub-family G member 1-like [Pogonomyrmex barbatus]